MYTYGSYKKVNFILSRNIPSNLVPFLASSIFLWIVTVLVVVLILVNEHPRQKENNRNPSKTAHMGGMSSLLQLHKR